MKSTRSKTAASDWLRKHMPTREQMARNKYLKPIAHRFLSPELWRFTRRSVPRGIALGLFCSFIIPVGQIFLAAFMALPARANVPLATLVTFVTNPFTFPFWAVIANRVGRLTLAADREVGGIASDQFHSGRWSWVSEFFQTAGITAFGFGVLAIVTSALGYVLGGFAWRFMMRRKRSKRLRRMEARLDQRLEAEGG